MAEIVSVDFVEQTARLGGFDFPPERCRELAPQLEWLLLESARVRSVLAEGPESVLVFAPGRHVVAAPQVDGDV